MSLVTPVCCDLTLRQHQEEAEALEKLLSQWQGQSDHVNRIKKEAAEINTLLSELRSDEGPFS